jgi:hypothetical protein
VEALPPIDQELMGRQLLSHVERLRQLREDLDKGIRSVDAGAGQPLDIDRFIEEKNAGYGRS